MNKFLVILWLITGALNIYGWEGSKKSLLHYILCWMCLIIVLVGRLLNND